LAELAVGRSTAIVGEMSFDQLVESLARDYAINDRKTASNLSYRIAHLRGHFGKLTASEISYDAMTRYISARMTEGAAPATVQHELACLGRMLTLAVRSRRLAVKPPIPTIKLQNARTGFFEAEDVERVAQQLPEASQRSSTAPTSQAGAAPRSWAWSGAAWIAWP